MCCVKHVCCAVYDGPAAHMAQQHTRDNSTHIHTQHTHSSTLALCVLCNTYTHMSQEHTWHSSTQGTAAHIYTHYSTHGTVPHMCMMARVCVCVLCDVCCLICVLWGLVLRATFFSCSRCKFMPYSISCCA